MDSNMWKAAASWVGRNIAATVAMGAAVATAVIIMVAFVWNTTSLSVDTDGGVEMSPTTMLYLKGIGQWEMLSVEGEEVADTVRHGLFGDDHLIRIYGGTARIGFDTMDAAPGWITMEGDTVVVELPPVKLLDEHFIDEASARPFYESGTWSQADREALYMKAYRSMRERSLSDENIKAARENAVEQFSGLLRALGFDKYKVYVSAQGGGL